jgi:FtsP/CotA-like multicopper oxidase with cupredoxin domain
MLMADVTGEVDYVRNGFNPSEILIDYDAGEIVTLPNGQTLHSYRLVTAAKPVEIAPGVLYPAWTYNGRIPGPTLRVRQGDRVRIAFVNATGHAHGLHFHGIHPGNMDGANAQVPPGGTFTYEFDAEPFGVHLYHCHASPLAEHLARGLYGAFIVDPRQGWPPADHEFVMVTSGTDVNFDGQNEFRYQYPGRYLFHAHKTEFAERGWTGLFQVEEA